MQKPFNMETIFVMLFLVGVGTALDSVLHTKDPVDAFIDNIKEPSPAIYCKISIDKGQKVSEAKPSEKEAPVKEITTKVKIEDWFGTEKGLQRVTDTGDDKKTPKTSLGYILSDTENGYFMKLKLSGNKKVYVPKVEKTEKEGYGIVFDCYTVNDKRILKRQKQLLNCAADAENFSIMQKRKLGNKYDGGAAWTDNQNDIGLQKLVKPMEYYYIGPLSFYGDGFISVNDGKCQANIYSGVHRLAVSLSCLATALLVLWR